MGEIDSLIEDIKEYEMSAYSMFGKDEIERKKERLSKIDKK